MARISDNILPPGSQLGMYLDRYQELVGPVDMCAWNGINRPTDDHGGHCVDIVTQSQRDDLAKYLLQAEEMREEELGYYTAPKYRQEEQDVSFGNPFMLEKKYLIYVGYPTYTVISAGDVIDHGPVVPDPNTPPNDPVTLTVATTVAASEIIVRYPGETARIYPTSVTVAAGIATILIPRCRLVKPEYNDDRDDPPSYFDPDVFLETVDVYRFYADISNGAEFIWRTAPCDTDCEPNCQRACAIVSGAMAYELSIVHLYPATYSNGVWTRSNCFAYNAYPTSVRVTYLSGRRPYISNQLYTIRLAHTLMPRPPCDCDIVRLKWEDDRKVDERRYSTYGNMQGALLTWAADAHAKIGHGGMLGGRIR